MKTLKFRAGLAKLILDGTKTTTWRLFDDKALAVNDIVHFLVWETQKEFAKACITEVKETTLGALQEEDWKGHEKFSSQQEMYSTYSKYYNCKVDENSPLKIIKFKLLTEQSAFRSIPRQSARLEERHAADSYEVICCGMKIIVNPGVYQTSGDSDLIAEAVTIEANERFLEIGCGTGVVSIALAKRSAGGVSVDINEKAVENSKQNAVAHGINNVVFFRSNLFEKINDNDKFDVIVCNPPYTKHDIRDDIDRMFWDPEDAMKQAFFKEAGRYLNHNGRIYFGWANFADIDINLPFKLAEMNWYKLTKTFCRPHGTDFMFYVFEFKAINSLTKTI